ncbi:MAG: lycopene cyclase domain-containing protein [Candidatus Hodarchaeota archaeon]
MLTYSIFLILFIGTPLIFFCIFYLKNYQKGDENRKKTIRRILIAIVVLIIVAIIYTSPWDNYLVENAIWYYDPSKTMGLLIGFVPIEEYFFFVVQTLLVGLFFGLTFLKKNSIKHKQYDHRLSLQLISVFALLIIWFIACFAFINDLESLTYLNLIILWGIPPIMIQLLYGVDILLLFRQDLLLTISLSTIYLAIADAIAINNGIWTISSGTSTNLLLVGVLPIEEFLFFLVTNILITFGLTLIIDSRSINRFNGLYSPLKQRIFKKSSVPTDYEK